MLVLTDARRRFGEPCADDPAPALLGVSVADVLAAADLLAAADVLAAGDGLVPPP